MVSMAMSLMIPGVVDGQDLHSVQRDGDKSFQIVLELGLAATELFNASGSGSRFDLLVLTIEPSMILALDDVYVSQASIGAGEQALMSATLDAGEVRIV
jgi:hypothetical protein